MLILLNLLFINIHNVLGEGSKLRNHKLTLESLRDEYRALLDDPAIYGLLSVWWLYLATYFVNWLKSSLMLSIP